MTQLLLIFFILPNLVFSSSSTDPDFDALMVLSKNCASCHQKDSHPGALFLNQSRLSERETLNLIKRLITTSQMPPAHGRFKKTEDGKKILKWLEEKEKSPLGK